MIDRLLFLLTLFSALGCGLIAGVFFAFSAFVMKALARIPPAQGIAAMQSINVVVINPGFSGGVFWNGRGLRRFDDRSLAGSGTNTARSIVLVGGMFYLVGTILVTIVFNVPRNNALAAVDPASAEGARLWARYLTSWTAWNHVRTAAALAAAASLTLAIC